MKRGHAPGIEPSSHRASRIGDAGRGNVRLATQSHGHLTRTGHARKNRDTSPTFLLQVRHKVTILSLDAVGAYCIMRCAP
jgi:hypothetical protein